MVKIKLMPISMGFFLGDIPMGPNYEVDFSKLKTYAEGETHAEALRNLCNAINEGEGNLDANYIVIDVPKAP